MINVDIQITQSHISRINRYKINSELPVDTHNVLQSGPNFIFSFHFFSIYPHGLFFIKYIPRYYNLPYHWAFPCFLFFSFLYW